MCLAIGAFSHSNADKPDVTGQCNDRLVSDQWHLKLGKRPPVDNANLKEAVKLPISHSQVPEGQFGKKQYIRKSC